MEATGAPEFCCVIWMTVEYFPQCSVHAKWNSSSCAGLVDELMRKCWLCGLCFPSQVSVTAREDVPPFGPVLPDPPIFTEVGNEAIRGFCCCLFLIKFFPALICLSILCWENSFWPNSSMQRFPVTRLNSSADSRWRSKTLYYCHLFTNDQSY